MLILLIGTSLSDSRLYQRASCCILFANFHSYSHLTHVLILPHAGRKEYGPFIGPVRRNFTADLTWVAELSEPLLSFPAPVPHPFLDSLLDTLFPLGLGHLHFPCSISSGSWRWAGKFTSCIRESTWLPSGHVWPYSSLWRFWFACTDFFVACC